jgi:hypothetical protein
MNLGPWVNDPRITRQTSTSVAVGSDYAFEFGDWSVMTRKDGVMSDHLDLPSALRYLLGEPRTPLVHALAVEFTAAELQDLADQIDLPGTEGESPTWDRLLAALVEARKVN